ncbi:hypothetical protein V6C53_16380 [Desulfocurvibacter africanus]|uniref:hypothetical protein n=1 Tax=Desulfocurvibacter africanus TaxID=873 RepID=UPI002FDAF6F5
MKPEMDSFSRFGGGPFQVVLRKIGASGVGARIVLILAFCWLPLALLTALQGTLLGESVRVAFLEDVVVQTRLLLVMPLLLAAEAVIVPRLRGPADQFARYNLIAAADEPAFDAAVSETRRRRENLLAEVLALLALALLGLFEPRTELYGPLSTWKMLLMPSGLEHTPAGWWHSLLSLPVYRFLLLRWLWRYLLWARFLWRLSRLGLRLEPIHPDRMGGLGFLPKGQAAFASIVFAFSCSFAGGVAGRILHAGESFRANWTVSSVFMVLNAALVLLPLFVFIPRLASVKRRGLQEYGALSSRYALSFEGRWLRGQPLREDFLGTGDIQSLADLDATFQNIRAMRVVPLDLALIKVLVLAAFLPLLPLLLTELPLVEILKRLAGVLL